MPLKYFSTFREAWFLASHPQLWGRPGLEEQSLPADPFNLFNFWYADAKKAWFTEFPNAMILSTISSQGDPEGRVVLLKGLDTCGFVFYTNTDSHKGKSLAAHPLAALTFYWGPSQRQVRVFGKVEEVSAKESDEYFASRPRESQIGAWASHQSAVLQNREELENYVKKKREEFGESPIQRPPFWGGYRVVPERIEFWQLRLSRLHDRIRYFQESGSWLKERLSP
jgi:pyridoxamine 5'-phosphate oxidase